VQNIHHRRARDLVWDLYQLGVGAGILGVEDNGNNWLNCTEISLKKMEIVLAGVGKIPAFYL